MAVVVYFSVALLHIIFESYTDYKIVKAKENFGRLVCLRKVRYFLVTVNACFCAYILIVTKYSCISSSWYIYVILVGLWATIITWLLMTLKLLITGCPTEESLFWEYANKEAMAGAFAEA